LIRDDAPLEVDCRQNDEDDREARGDNSLAAQAETRKAGARDKRAGDRDGRPTSACA
jgi:hypothetical protein